MEGNCGGSTQRGEVAQQAKQQVNDLASRGGKQGKRLRVRPSRRPRTRA